MIITNENWTILKNRVKSFLWRFAGIAAVALLNFVAEQINLFNLPEIAIVVIGLVVGELTKFINTNLPEIQARRIQKNIDNQLG